MWRLFNTTQDDRNSILRVEEEEQRKRYKLMLKFGISAFRNIEAPHFTIVEVERIRFQRFD